MLHARADEADVPGDTIKTVHRIALDAVPSTIIHTNDFLRGLNGEERTMNHDMTMTLKYAFMNRDEVRPQSIYHGAYQGIGLARHEFNQWLSNPISVYVFQGAPVVNLSRTVSLCYEWNLGMAFGWNAYDADTNPDNMVIGSKVTAYLDVDLYVKWRLARCLDLNVGMSVSHFSNGNTSYPNMGLNTGGIRLGLAYLVNRPKLPVQRVKREKPVVDNRFYVDAVLFGAWKRHGVYADGANWLLPGTYAVMGLNVNPMYRLNPWFSLGGALDAVYDRSANLYEGDYDYSAALDGERVRRSFFSQSALGLSARAEFAMPYFSINFGVGTNVLGNKGDMKGVYEILALKVHVTKRAMLHIGYSLVDFKTPNNLMLGVGWRFMKK